MFLLQVTIGRGMNTSTNTATWNTKMIKTKDVKIDNLTLKLNQEIWLKFEE